MDLFYHQFQLNRNKRQDIKNQKSCTIWLFGLSACGKSTIANLLETTLHNCGYHTFILDGDNTRLGLNRDLGFSDSDRNENIRRVSEVCKLMNDAGIIVICSFISPFQKNRIDAKNIIGDDFIEVFVDTPLNVCEERDPKGLYKKARNGEIKDFTGISSPFEVPTNTLTLKNNNENDLQTNVDLLVNHLKNKNYIK